ncbi:MAG: archaeal proteasome endopeptidase complex subunit alpha [Candidatus Aenigmatarchaeota archaeon]
MAEPVPPSHMAYDRTIVVFSPEGRLLQVEYARQMVKNGITSIGIRLSDGVLLGTVKIAPQLAVLDSYKKIYQIDEHIAAVISGSLADGKELAEIARVKAQVNRITFGEKISILSLVSHICDRKHMVTQYAGVRPYGVGMLIGGVDDVGPRLFETDPSGTMMEWYAQAIGRGGEKARKILIKGYKKDMNKEEGIKLLINALKEGEKGTGGEYEVVYVTKSGVERIEEKMISKYA